MKLLTRDTDYGLRALCFIAKSKEKVIPASTLVEKLKIPRPFLRKIMQRLQKTGILESHRGIGGGFVLAKPVNKIFLVDLIEIFQGPFQLNECFFKKMKCPHTPTCALRGEISKIEKDVVARLRSITIASLIK